jgi:hypothetical protein
MHLDVVNLSPFCPVYAVGAERFANGPGEVDEWLEVSAVDGESVIFDEEKPVAAPRNVADDAAVYGHVYNYAGGQAIAGDVLDGDLPVVMQSGSHYADGGFYAVPSRLYFAQPGEGNDKADGAVAAHPQAAAVVKKNDPGGTILVNGVAQQSTHYRFGSARLSDHRPAEGCVVLLQARTLLLQGAHTQIRSSGDDATGGFSASV